MEIAFLAKILFHCIKGIANLQLQSHFNSLFTICTTLNPLSRFVLCYETISCTLRFTQTLLIHFPRNSFIDSLSCDKTPEIPLLSRAPQNCINIFFQIKLFNVNKMSLNLTLFTFQQMSCFTKNFQLNMENLFALQTCL
jgi:hypothetical protein